MEKAQLFSAFYFSALKRQQNPLNLRELLCSYSEWGFLMSFFNFIMLTHSVLTPAKWLVEMQWREMKKWKMQNLNSNKLPFSLFILQLSTSFFSSRLESLVFPTTSNNTTEWNCKTQKQPPVKPKRVFSFFFWFWAATSEFSWKKYAIWKFIMHHINFELFSLCSFLRDFTSHSDHSRCRQSAWTALWSRTMTTTRKLNEI